MNMNLNFSINVGSNSLGNDSYKSKDMKSDMFGGLFESIGSLENNSKDIDYDMILSVLSNMKILNTENIQNNISIDDIQQGDISNIELNDLNSICEYLSDKNTNIGNLNQILKNVISSIENQVYEENINLDSIIEKISLSKDEIELINNMKNKLGMGDSDNKDLLDYTQGNRELKIDEEDLNLNKDMNTEKYNELEVNSLSNKINLVEIKDTDKDLVTLENILNEDDNNNFSIINNMNLDNKLSLNLDINEEQVITNIRQEFISEDIVKTIKHLKSDGLEQITVKITPKELGELSIQLIKDADETKVKIIISKEDVYNLVNKNLSEIVKHLEESNINVKEISIDIKNNNQKNFSDNLNNEFDGRNKENQQKKSKTKREAIQVVENEEKMIEEDNLNILI